MAKSTQVMLADHQFAFVETQVAEGHYGSVSAVVQAGLRLLEEQEAQFAQLRDALIEGENSPRRDFDPDAFLVRLHETRQSGE
jgi:antitoxin ParD1/3/4